MATVDIRLIDPPPAELVKALERATRSANRKLEGRLVNRDRAFWQRFVRRVARQAEGLRHWAGSKADSFTRPTARMVAAWWSDYLGRRHFRVLGLQEQRRPFRHGLVRKDHLSSPPLCLLQPWRTVIHHHGGQRELLVVCPCGTCGTPKAIAWMGEHCGACHDRREEASPPPASRQDLFVSPGNQAAPPASLSFTPDSCRVVFLKGCRLISWDRSSGTSQKYARFSAWWYPAMVLLSDGTRVVTANHGGVVWEHDLTTGQKRTLLRSRTILCNLALSPDGHVLFAGGGDPCLLLDLGTLASQPVSCLAGRQIFCAAFRGNRELFACDAEGNLLHIDLHRDVARIVVRGPEPPPADQPYDDYDGAYHPHHRLLAVSADGRRFAYSEVGNSSRFCVGETSPERWRQTSSVVGQVHSLAFSPDNRTLAGLIVGGALAFWDAVTCQKIGTFTWPGRRPSALSFAPDGTTLAVGYWDGTVQLWPWRALLDAR